MCLRLRLKKKPKKSKHTGFLWVKLRQSTDGKSKEEKARKQAAGEELSVRQEMRFSCTLDGKQTGIQLWLQSNRTMTESFTW